MFHLFKLEFKTWSTKQVTWDQNDQQKMFDHVESPNINDYTPDKSQVNAVSVNPSSDDLFETVVYHKSAPTEPKKPIAPEQPAKSNKPVEPSKSNQPETKTRQTPKQVSPKAPTKQQETKRQSPVQQKKTKKQALPQTGNEQSAAVSALGLLGLTTGLSLGLKKRKRS